MEDGEGEGRDIVEGVGVGVVGVAVVVGGVWGLVWFGKRGWEGVVGKVGEIE